jgi:hypothetical protein
MILNHRTPADRGIRCIVGRGQQDWFICRTMYPNGWPAAPH